MEIIRPSPLQKSSGITNHDNSYYTQFSNVGRSIGRKRTALKNELFGIEGPLDSAPAWIQGASLGFTITLVQAYIRETREIRAWDLRVRENRGRKYAADPTLTQRELVRQEAAMSNKEIRERDTFGGKEAIVERGSDGGRKYRLSGDQIMKLEELGVKYDPYYDDPYTEDEMPDDVPFKIMETYHDRMYKNGEIFFFDEQTGFYFRQGSKPRFKPFYMHWIDFLTPGKPRKSVE